MGNSLIDKETFEVYYYEKDFPNVFLVDQPLAYPISLLNKKGYKTLYSCSGHYYFVHETFHQEMYILFDKVYQFDTLPDGFIKEITTSPEGIERTRIFYEINNYKTVGNEEVVKERWDFDPEIEVLSQRLMKWVENLPDYKERND